MLSIFICMEKDMTKPFIVVSDGFDKNAFEELKKVEEFEVYPESKITQDKLKELLPKINGLVIRSASKVTSETLETAPNLKYVIRAGEGTDNIDKVACESKGVKVSNTPGANSNSAAEHAVALMLTVLRHTAKADKTMKDGQWAKSSLGGNELWKKKVGFVGFGKIAQIVAKRISGFEPEITYYNRSEKNVDLDNVTYTTDLKKIFSESDIITIHLPATPETQDLINKELLSLMKKDAILINAARGKIVNENDIYEVLKNGDIKGAGFDVFANEPLEDGSKLRELDNIVLTPHLGASTAEAQIRVGEMAANQLKEFFLNGKLLNEVKAKK